MCSGSRCPGSDSGHSVPEWAMSRGDTRVEEPPNESSVLGLWEPRREHRLALEDNTRSKLACRALVLLSFFIVAGIVSITWVTLAGKPATAIGNCVEVIATPLFGLVMLVLGYYYGHSRKQ
jgi:hypothetical protein